MQSNYTDGVHYHVEFCFMFLRHEKPSKNKDADVENGLKDTGRGKGKLGQSERVAWTYIHYQT